MANGMGLLVAFAIVAIGAWYVAPPRAAVRGFGLPLPEEGANVAWWLRLKRTRDIVSASAGASSLVGGPKAATSTATPATRIGPARWARLSISWR